MANVARLVGMEIREYEKDGQKKQYCALHLMYLEDSQPDVMGCKVEEASCPREVDPNALNIGTLYELEYTMFRMRGQLCARLSGLVPIHEDAPAKAGKA